MGVRLISEPAVAQEVVIGRLGIARARGIGADGTHAWRFVIRRGVGAGVGPS